MFVETPLALTLGSTSVPLLPMTPTAKRMPRIKDTNAIRPKRPKQMFAMGFPLGS